MSEERTFNHVRLYILSNCHYPYVDIDTFTQKKWTGNPRVYRHKVREQGNISICYSVAVKVFKACCYTILKKNPLVRQTL